MVEKQILESTGGNLRSSPCAPRDSGLPHARVFAGRIPLHLHLCPLFFSSSQLSTTRQSPAATLYHLDSTVYPSWSDSASYQHRQHDYLQRECVVATKPVRFFTQTAPLQKTKLFSESSILSASTNMNCRRTSSLVTRSSPTPTT